MAIPEDVDSFSSWWIGKSVNTDVTVIIFVDVDGVVLTNAVLHDLSTALWHFLPHGTYLIVLCIIVE